VPSAIPRLPSVTLSLVCFLDAVNFCFFCKLASGKQVLICSCLFSYGRSLTYLVHDKKKAVETTSGFQNSPEFADFLWIRPGPNSQIRTVSSKFALIHLEIGKIQPQNSDDPAGSKFWVSAKFLNVGPQHSISRSSVSIILCGSFMLASCYVSNVTVVLRNLNYIKNCI
jgi:hypothetical protein